LCFVPKSKKPAGHVVRQRAWIPISALVIRDSPPTRSSHGDDDGADGSAESL
jgi:hypothetical protein